MLLKVSYIMYKQNYAVWKMHITFRCFGPSNYACMQDDTFTGELSSVDIASDENLQNLVRVGEELLKKPVSRVNLQTGAFEPLNKGTNEDALKRYNYYLAN